LFPTKLGEVRCYQEAAGNPIEARIGSGAESSNVSCSRDKEIKEVVGNWIDPG